jgi:hypothetical protein
MPLRRARGAILRLARRRPMAIAAGTAMAAPTIWLELNGGSSIWWVNGLAWIIASTGVALIWAGVSGPRPDWMDNPQV